jgi:hypothetical protein
MLRLEQWWAVGRKDPRKLVVAYDVTGLSKGAIDFLGAEVAVQGESSDGHPGVRGTSRIVTIA